MSDNFAYQLLEETDSGKKVYRGVRLGSTLKDAQGETLSLSFWKNLVSKTSVMPLTQQHDLSLSPIGELRNFRIVDYAEFPGEHLVLGDLFLEKGRDLKDIPGKGFSFSATGLFRKIKEDDIAKVFLPFPHYSNYDYIHCLEDEFPDMAMGEIKRKAADPLAVAIVCSVAPIVLTPIYNRFFADKINSFLERLPVLAKSLQTKQIELQVSIPVVTSDGRSFVLELLPRNGKTFTKKIKNEKIYRANLEANKIAMRNFKEIKRIVFSEDKSGNTFIPLCVYYENGTYEVLTSKNLHAKYQI